MKPTPISTLVLMACMFCARTAHAANESLASATSDTVGAMSTPATYALLLLGLGLMDALAKRFR
ncbi:MAG: hypothetical protein EOP38_21415 [Rubrivivax sp.]|nr:MAG: hypothetical protein EOP38_21415 [Rubrivivax sp.]